MSSEWKPVTDRSAWRPDDLENDGSWRFELEPGHVGELDRALANVKDRPFGDITKDDFPLPTLSGLLRAVQGEIRDGRGIAVVSGVPIHYDYADLERIYWGIGAHIGTGVTQNSETGLIHYITDGALAPQQGARILGRPRPSKLHVDLSDVVGLFCVHQAPDNPLSLVASSMTVYNEILDRHPEYLERLEEGFYWDRKGPHASELPHSDFRVPAWSAVNDIVSCRFHAGWIRSGQNKAGRELTEEETKIFQFIEDVGVANAFAFELKEGDIAFWNNYTTFHGREGFAETSDESQKRVLLRLWLDLDNVRPFADEARVRFGPIRHGQLGWTAEEVRAGKNAHPFPRNEEGVPILR